MIRQLEKFSAIGWDFDNTLVDHPKSHLFHQFIKENPQKTHVIITFRTHGLRNAIFENLARYQNAPDKSYFSKIFSISDEAWLAHSHAQSQRMMGVLKGSLTPPEVYYITWKGDTCKRDNIPVLIDDKPEDTVPGCEKYGVTYFHPDDL